MNEWNKMFLNKTLILSFEVMKTLFKHLSKKEWIENVKENEKIYISSGGHMGKNIY